MVVPALPLALGKPASRMVDKQCAHLYTVRITAKEAYDDGRALLNAIGSDSEAREMRLASALCDITWTTVSPLHAIFVVSMEQKHTVGTISGGGQIP
ncbi:hypothetical protein Tco_0698717 [Tanacetum coccineum]